jgi:aminoglycoside/choline kinase family phosphotransferase
MDVFNTKLGKEREYPQGRFDEDYLKSWLEPLVKEPVSRFEFFTLKGDASDRSYFRVHYYVKSHLTEKSSIIVMQLKEVNSEKEPDFNRMQSFLKHLDMPVPEILYYDAKRGLLFLEDGGDMHLEDITRNSPDNIILWYQKAIDLIVSMQTHVTKNMQPYCPAYALKFDVKKLMWEMDFMIKHYIQGFLKRELSQGEESKVRTALLGLCQTLAKEERVFVHRDFHSRNLMIRKNALMLLDFQDARMGPRQYDLVSLLKDSYVTLKEETRNELLSYYLQRMGQEQGQPIAHTSFLEIFDSMSIQRNLKAIGTFAFQYMEHKNERYLEYLDPTLQHIRDTIHSQPDLEQLGQVLKQLIPELNADKGSGATQS